MEPANRHPNVFLITGPVQSGKTTFAIGLMEELRMKGKSVKGILCPGTFRSGRRAGFQLVNAATGEQIPMASDQESDGWYKYRRFYFNPEAFVLGKEWISSGIAGGCDLLVIDEVGPLEMEGRGWSEMIKILLPRTELLQLWVVREQIIEEVLKRWNLQEENLVTIQSFDIKEAMDQLTGIFIKKMK